MTPEEIVAQIHRENRNVLFSYSHARSFNVEQVLELMDAAAIRGFRIGSDVALSMIQGTLTVEIARVPGLNDKPVL